MTETITGTDRSAGISYAELLDQDAGPVDDVLRDESRIGLSDGNTRIPAWYYTSPEFHALEVEKLWSRVWQLACLEDEIPSVGDYHVYEIADMSFLVVRTEDGVKAFRNACLHRGRLLRESNGKGARNLRCAFHGWAWNLDGSMKEIPCEWDFPSVRKEDYALPEALVDTWQGFVFINPDRDAPPLADFLGDLGDHFAKCTFDRRYKAAHVEKIMRVNWKACQEAFMESYHVVATHPTLMEDLGDANSRYDTYENFSRAISPHAVESPHLTNMAHYERLDDGKQFARYRHPMNGHIYERIKLGLRPRHRPRRPREPLRRRGDVDRRPDRPGRPASVQVDRRADARAASLDVPLTLPDPPDGIETPAEIRAWIAAQRRDAARETSARTSTPTGSATPRSSTRCTTRCSRTGRRGGCSTRSSTGGVPTATTPTVHLRSDDVPGRTRSRQQAAHPPRCAELGPDDDWTIATELGAAAKIFQQDSINLPHVQTGLKAQEQQEVMFANYNETKIRHFWENMFRWLEIGATNVSVTPRTDRSNDVRRAGPDRLRHR